MYFLGDATKEDDTDESSVSCLSSSPSGRRMGRNPLRRNEEETGNQEEGIDRTSRVFERSLNGGYYNDNNNDCSVEWEALEQLQESQGKEVCLMHIMEQEAESRKLIPKRRSGTTRAIDKTRKEMGFAPRKEASTRSTPTTISEASTQDFFLTEDSVGSIGVGPRAHEEGSMAAAISGTGAGAGAGGSPPSRPQQAQHQAVPPPSRPVLKINRTDLDGSGSIAENDGSSSSEQSSAVELTSEQQMMLNLFREQLEEQRPARHVRYERASNPGAVQVNGRAFGLPRPGSNSNRDSSSRRLTSGFLALLQRGGSNRTNYTNLDDERHIENNRPSSQDQEQPAETEDDGDRIGVDTTTTTNMPIEKFKTMLRKHVCIALSLFFMVGLSLGIFVPQLFGGQNDDKVVAAKMKIIRNALEEFTPYLKLNNPFTPQYKALEWLSRHDRIITNYSDPGLAQRYAAVVLFYAKMRIDDEEELTSHDYDDYVLQGDSNECDWDLYYCVETGRERQIVKILMDLDGMKELPYEIGLLTSLESLDVNSLFLKELPSVIASLENLKLLNASKNSLSVFPMAVYNLSSLEYLDLSSNALEGTLEDSLGSLLELKYLDLKINLLSGQLPTTIRTLTSLEYLSLASNDFKGVPPGCLPTSLRVINFASSDFEFDVSIGIDGMYDLEELDLRGNNVLGAIPSTISSLTNLRRLYLSENNIKGSIPSTIGNLTNLNDLDLAINKLFGTLPTELGMLHELRNLWVDGNSISGTLPTTLGKLSNIEKFHAEINNISGTIPTELGGLQNAHIVSLNWNNLTGSVPTEICSLQQFGSLRCLGVGISLVCNCCTFGLRC
mmetsp:Transcript_9264/g.14391  ORF Transcript_9264/g.14391 Transcript_9264/m.14391 type:complete len:837 (-) Transcript_9264:641-3151(-)